MKQICKSEIKREITARITRCVEERITLSAKRSNVFEIFRNAKHMQ